MNFVTHLECANCGQKYDAAQIHNLCTACNRPLWVKYDLPALKKAFPKEKLAGRPPTLWRYLEMLPISDPSKIVSLVETISPILETKRLAAAFGVNHLFMKDESRLPTGSFKARGMALAISKANEFGIKTVAVPTAGNAGGAMAAYAARAGMEAYVFMPEDTPAINKKECYLAGAKTFLVNGLITDCGRIVGEGKKAKGWFDVSTLKEPYRIEGKKTMGLELAEQFDWELPDVILYPTGGGTGLIGMWKAFGELEALGWLKSPKKPKMISCQSDGCAPIAVAFAKGERFAALPVAASRAVKLGGTVATVGFPNIGLQGFAPKFAKGEIAALSGAQDDAKYFQISVPVQPGNSGGALVDEHGNVVGIVSAKLSARAALAKSGALPENVNYAVKSSFLLSFLESVPEVSAKLKEPNTKERKFDDVVKDAEKAAVFVLVY